MRRCSATASISDVPTSSRSSEKMRATGSSSSGSLVRSSRMSAYTTPAHGRPCVSSSPPPSSASATVGNVLISRSRSAMPTRGIDLRSSSESSRSCAAFRALVSAMTFSRSASDIFAFTAASSASSAAFCDAASVSSGTSSSVVRWSLSTSILSSVSSNTFSPEARRSLRRASGASKRSASVGEPRPYSQRGITFSISERPFGKPPVLNSRRENSIVFRLASMASASKPSAAAFLSVARASSSTLATSSGCTPFRPTEKVACFSSSDSPPPMSDAPRPDSLIGL
mmetsp:Transcript_54400/g.140544  ORF Transcript_54400/g.140544 Transcript_54400/m.140544 type:complete len:284 (-) Transcript_54400:1160-2011(-)